MARIIETVTHYDDTKPACKTAPEMEKLCCDPTAALQCCEKVETDWQGYTADEIQENFGLFLDDMGRDSQGRYVNIELVPRTKPCGEKKIIYDLGGKNCCDEVAPIVWDYDQSVDVIPDESNGQVFIIGGRPPYRWRISGQGMFLNPACTKKELVTDRKIIRIYTNEWACGWNPITVTDGCTTVNAGVRSTNGNWYPILNPNPLPESSANYWPVELNIGHGYLEYPLAILIKDDIKITQTVDLWTAANIHAYNCCADTTENCCNDPNRYYDTEPRACYYYGGGILKGWSESGAISFDVAGTIREPINFFGETNCGYVYNVHLNGDPCSSGFICAANLAFKNFDSRGINKFEWRC